MNNLNQHAHDIAHAVFRVATLIHNRKLRIELEDIAIDFLSNFEEALHPTSEHKASVFDKLERMISLAESTKEMKEINAQVLKRELNNLLAKLKEDSAHRKTIDDINLSDEFNNTNKKEDLNIEKFKNLNSNVDNSIKPSQPLQNKTLEGELTERQESILRKIREIPECKLRDLMASFQDISERTIRNEVRALREHGLVRRMGNGGPNSYFESNIAEVSSS